jgi:hypothetical protein
MYGLTPIRVTKEYDIPQSQFLELLGFDVDTELEDVMINRMQYRSGMILHEKLVHITIKTPPYLQIVKPDKPRPKPRNLFQFCRDLKGRITNA